MKIQHGIISCGRLTSIDLLAVGYVIHSSPRPVTSLSVCSSIHDDGIVILLKQLQQAHLGQLADLLLQDEICDEETELLCGVLKKPVMFLILLYI